MASLQLHVATSVSQYLSIVSSISREQGERTWFRGHSSAHYQLVPSVLRQTTPLRDSYGRKLRGNEVLNASGNTVTGFSPERMLAEFKRKARPFLAERPADDFEWLFLMQHYGVPTRLLDWTTNALVALYFATETLSPGRHKSARGAEKKFASGDEYREDGFAIYAIDPRAINNEIHEIQHAVDVCSDDRWLPYARPMDPSPLNTHFPLCILAPHNSPRIRAQSGTFTIHGSNIWALDYFDVLRPLIHKIFVPYACVKAFQDDLVSFGFTASFIYPDLGGVAQEVRNNEWRRYGLERGEWAESLESEA